MKPPPSEFIRDFLFLMGINPDALVPAPLPLPVFLRKHPTPMTIQLHPQCLLGIQSI